MEITKHNSEMVCLLDMDIYIEDGWDFNTRDLILKSCRVGIYRLGLAWLCSNAIDEKKMSLLFPLPSVIVCKHIIFCNI